MGGIVIKPDNGLVPVYWYWVDMVEYGSEKSKNKHYVLAMTIVLSPYICWNEGIPLVTKMVICPSIFIANC